MALAGKLSDISNSLTAGRPALKEAFRPVRSRQTSLNDDGEGSLCEHGRFVRGAFLSKHVDHTRYDAVDDDAGTDVTWIVASDKAQWLPSAADLKIMQHIHHSNIMLFHDSWAAGRTVTLITEHMSLTAGMTVSEIVHSTGMVPRLRVLQGWMRQALAALQYLHTRRPHVVHRDIRCSNMFVLGRTLKLGAPITAAVLHDGTATGLVGQMEMRAPEMYQGPYTESVDVYAAGLALLHMATRHAPYDECRGDETAVRAKALSCGPEGISLLWSREAGDFVRACIHPDPDMRPKPATLQSHPFMNTEGPDSHVLRICKVLASGSVQLRMNKVTQGSPSPSGALSPGGSTLQSIDFTLDADEDSASVARQLVNEGLIEPADEMSVAQTISYVPLAVAYASEGSMVADVAQAYLDALCNGGPHVADMLKEMAAKQAQERAHLARQHVQALKDLLRPKSHPGSGSLSVPRVSSGTFSPMSPGFSSPRHW